ncbi:hypothetical protein LSUE1_G003449 [Lachnellula suecica]|uniref:Uncharacterized protein n=1 Tax=Lachnellula suecica TaxID=602035 RepID=A0A8T9C9L7_9HELO|nr:hypothetical protein LSUE1_G003449 [Lachnellula suecica]
MDSMLQQPQLDELGLPIRPANAPPLPDVDEDDFQKFINGDFSALGMSHLPQPVMPTRNEAQREARERSAEVISSWTTLRQILERYEDVLRKRWAKKTKVQRAKVISETWPKMSATHRPDYAALSKEGSQLRNRKTAFREAYLWPYMNIEDLVRGKTLLLFLNSRGRHPPSMFAHADIEATRVGRVSTAIIPIFLNVHTMLLDGEAVDTYGRLVSWEEDEDSMDKMFNGLAYQPGDGLLILEIQQRILIFLVECCQAILHEFTPDNLLSADVQVKPEPPSISDSSEYSTLASMAAEAPYRLPALLDFKRLKTLTAAKLIGAEDHIRGLREDPGYFFDVIGDWSEHRQEQILDTNRKRHPVLDTPLFWDRVISNAVGDAYGNLIAWNIINEQLANLLALQTKYAKVINPQEMLPSEYMKALLTLRYTIDQTAKSPILLLKTGIVASPPLRSSVVREPHVPGSNAIRVQTKNGTSRMMWLFNNLWTETQLQLLGLPSITDEIENLIQKDPEEKAKLSPWVTQVFSDLGLLAHIRHEVDIYQPWAAGYDHAEVSHRAAIEKEFPLRFSLVADVVRNLGTTPWAKFGAPLDGRFNYPSDKRRTQQNTDIMREAEKNLDLFWEKVDESYRKANGKSLEGTIQHLIQENRPLERTQPWIEPVKAPKKSAPGKSDPNLVPSFFGLRLEHEDSPSKFTPLEPKTKPKTRGTPQGSVNTQPEPAAAATAQDTQPVFTLKLRSFKVFKVLFHTPSPNDLPGEISWADFLFAMAATGFAPEKLYGSIWQFTPSNLDVERSIQFHEPHPVGKIPFRDARRIGRRTYGWHGGMFALQ